MDQPVRTTCPYCGVGCGVLASRASDGSVTVRGDPAHPANRGRLCSKGSALGETLGLDGRLLYPAVAGVRAEWDTALDLVAGRFSQAIAEHGPESVAFYVSGQLLTEDYYVANKLMKGFIGAANIDTNSRLCMSSSVAGHKRAFGADTVPGTYEDLELADLVVLTGSNLAWCHPVLFQRLMAAKAARPALQIVVIDPRRSVTADAADLHLALRPDSDVALFAGLLGYLLRENRIDRSYVGAHTAGLAKAAAALPSLRQVCALTGLPASDIDRFYGLFATTEKTVTCYSQGVNQSASGTDKVNAILNCHLATGRIGKPGQGPFSLTGQPNAMGGREVGGLANMLAAHMDLENPVHRERVRRFWNAPAIAGKPGLKAVELFKAVADGRIKALWIMATNPVVSMPDADAVKAALAACPFVVVSDIYEETDTARHADVLLPSLGWGEKDGTVTNSERRISRQRAFLEPPGAARADWWQLAEVGRRMGHGPAFAYANAGTIFREHAALSAFENEGTRDFDIGALSEMPLAAYQGMDPVQWPAPAAGTGPARFFGAGGFYHADRKARFVPTPLPKPAPARDPALFTLNTGRIRDQWHTMTRTGRSARLSAHVAEPFVEIHPADAARLGIADADLVTLTRDARAIRVRALVTPRQQRGSLFAPMHWTDSHAASARVDRLVPDLADPHSGQPALKHALVSAARFPAAAFAFALSAADPVVSGAEYWAKARTDGGWRTELGFAAVPQDRVGWCIAAFGLTAGMEPLGYADSRSGDTRLAFFDGARLLAAVYFSARPVAVARSWAAAQLTTRHDTLASRLAVAAARPGGALTDAGATVCSCFGVGTRQISNAVRNGCHTVEAVGQALGAGTNCGSCRTEIRGIIDGCLSAAAE